MLYSCVPLITWFAAFLIWFYWNDLTGIAEKQTDRSRPVVKTNPLESAPAKQPSERILDEDRKKLEDILKQRG